MEEIKKILVINGSPAGKGNTFKVCTMVEKEVKKLDENIEFDYIHLKDCNLQMCKGCYACLLNGEDKCPLKDDRGKIEKKMLESNAVIFLTPVYVMNMSYLLKNFTDRFAYVCHRPRFHGKKAYIICSTGAVGAFLVSKISSMGPLSWGFSVLGSLKAVTSKSISKEKKKLQWEKISKQSQKISQKIVRDLNDKKIPKATLFQLISFNMQRKAFGQSNKEKADYKYWKDKGWLEKDCKFYIKARINLFKSILAKIISKFVG